MSEHQELRLARVEREVDDLHDTIDNLKTTIGQLNITIALLQQTIKTMKTESETRAALNQRIQFFFIGGFASALVAFVVKGGLVL